MNLTKAWQADSLFPLDRYDDKNDMTKTNQDSIKKSNINIKSLKNDGVYKNVMKILANRYRYVGFDL